MLFALIVIASKIVKQATIIPYAITAIFSTVLSLSMIAQLPLLLSNEGWDSTIIPFYVGTAVALFINLVLNIFYCRAFRAIRANEENVDFFIWKSNNCCATAVLEILICGGSFNVVFLF